MRWYFYILFTILGFLIGALIGSVALNEGKEKAALIYYLKGLKIPPEQARHVDIQMTVVDVQMSFENSKFMLFEGAE